MAVREILFVLVGNEARKRGKGSGLLGFGLGVVAARIATSSIPGALLVGGAMVAKVLYDRSQEEENQIPASEAIIDIEGKLVPEKAEA